MTDPSDFNPRDAGDTPTDAERADELASAYVDGEATAEEVTLIEGDPTSAERIAQFQAVATTTAAPVTPPPASVRAAHLAAAMAAFEETKSIDLTAAPASSTAAPPTIDTTPAEPVIDLTAAREARSARNSRFLTSAAAALLVVGGIGFASWRLGSSDSDETAGVEFAEDESSDDAVSGSSNQAGAAEANAAESAAMDEDTEAMEESAEASDFAGDSAEADVEEAMEDDEAMDDEADEDVAESDESAGEDADPGSDTTFTAQRSAVVVDDTFTLDVDSIPDLLQQTQDLGLEPLPLSESSCAATLGITAGVWFPIESAEGIVGELIIEIAESGEEIPRLIDSGCEFEPVSE